MTTINHTQCGAVLIISLIMLLLMTILGITAMRTGLLEEKMAANSRDQTLAFQAAEIALRDAETWLMSQAAEPLPTVDGGNRVWDANTLDPIVNNAIGWWQEPTRNATWWNNNGEPFTLAIDNVRSSPIAIIEYHQYISDDLVVGDGNADSGRVFYRITAKGTGGSDQSRILLQSTTAKRY